MKRKVALFSLFVFSAIIFCGATAYAETSGQEKLGKLLGVAQDLLKDPKAQEASKDASATVMSAPAATPEWVKYSMPGAGHEALNVFVGKWQHKVLWWQEPGKPANESAGTNENKWILGGRFLMQDVKGSMMGQPFEGLGITGYDNLKQEYNSIWIDSMATGMMTATAQYDAATKTFRETGTCSCPMTGEKNKWFRAEWKVIDNNNYRYEMYTKAADGQEFRSMEISYTRV